MGACGAKTRDGTPCKRWGMPNGRCSKHGGKSSGPPLGSKNARKHGIYSDALLPEESDLWESIAVGSLDDDIRIAKLQLRRALIAQNRQADDGLELYETSMNGGGAEGAEERPAATIKRRRTQYDEIISRLLGRIGDLEQKRTEMLEKNGGDKLNADESARMLREKYAEMKKRTGA